MAALQIHTEDDSSLIIVFRAEVIHLTSQSLLKCLPNPELVIETSNWLFLLQSLIIKAVDGVHSLLRAQLPEVLPEVLIDGITLRPTGITLLGDRLDVIADPFRISCANDILSFDRTELSCTHRGEASAEWHERDLAPLDYVHEHVATSFSYYIWTL